MNIRSRSIDSAQRTTRCKWNTVPCIPHLIALSVKAGSQLNGSSPPGIPNANYRLTAVWRKQLLDRELQWNQMADAIACVMWPVKESWDALLETKSPRGNFGTLS